MSLGPHTWGVRVGVVPPGKFHSRGHDGLHTGPLVLGQVLEMM